jgi:hypothetical protein
MYHVVIQIGPNGGGRPVQDTTQPGQPGAGPENLATEAASHARVGESGAEAAAEDGAPKEAKKERVLHTRVPAVLERELKRFADNLRVPVSNLVRTILEDALQVADAATENVEERLKRAARHLEKEREKLKKRMEHDPLEGIEAFQEITLAVATTCARCERDLPRGTRAHMGIERIERAAGQPAERTRRFVCQECLPRA